jgi:protein-tyrosine phosphatase
MSRFTPQLASLASAPPTASSYWVVPRSLVAGAYPGDPDSAKHHEKVELLIGAGIRTFVNLMEENETNWAGEPFVPYQDLVVKLCPEVTCVRYPIQDLSTPSVAQMASILDVIDSSVKVGKPAYVHCWGGVGRTGTVIGCWLLRHGLAEPSNVLATLMRLRKQDRKCGKRASPETDQQQEFVKHWRERSGSR